MFLKGKEDNGRCQEKRHGRRWDMGVLSSHRRGSDTHRVSTVLQWALTVFMPTMDFSTLVTYVTWSSLDLSSFCCILS